MHKTETNNKNRPPAVAGKFYPQNPQKLKNEVKKYLNNVKILKSNAFAAIAPHAGYIFSGQIAANAIGQFSPHKKYENVFIIAASHHLQLKGASIYAGGEYQMPGFSLEINKKIINKLIEENNNFEYIKDAHLQEHSIEVQLPFLHYHLKKGFKIIPIIIGTTNQQIIENISSALKPYLNDDNLFLVSSDFSHYPKYKDAIKIDKLTSEAILTNNPTEFLNTIKTNEQKNIDGLATSACGWTAILTLMHITKNLENIKYEIIDYKNSGDSLFGEKNSVVGYSAITISKTQQLLNDAEKKILKKIAQNSINSIVETGRIYKPNISMSTETLKQSGGAFVTLTKNGKLRGCIGTFTSNEPLYKVVAEMAMAAATQDGRFAPVGIDELRLIDIKISILTPLQKISTIDQIKIGRDGIYIKKNNTTGTLLPEVAVENGWNKKQFVEYCSKYKTRIGINGWKNAELFVYQTIIF